MKKILITIGRQCGSGGKQIGKLISEKLGIPYYDKELITKVCEDSGMDIETLEKHDEKRPSGFFIPLASVYNLDPVLSIGDKLFVMQSEAIKSIARNGSAVIVGRCSDYVLSEEDEIVDVFITMPFEQRVQRISEELGLPQDKAALHIARKDKQRGNYYTYYTGKKWGKFRNYDLIINSSVGMDATADIIIAYAKKKLKIEE